MTVPKGSLRLVTPQGTTELRPYFVSTMIETETCRVLRVYIWSMIQVGSGHHLLKLTFIHRPALLDLAI